MPATRQLLGQEGVGDGDGAPTYVADADEPVDRKVRSAGLAEEFGIDVTGYMLLCC